MAYYGGKTRLAHTIAALLPEHEHYVEPYAGSLAVLLAKRPSRMETVNDLDGDLMTFWRVLRDKPAELARVCALTPHSRADHQAAYGTDREDLDNVEIARLTWVQISQGRSGTLRKTGWRYYVNPGGSGAAMPTYLEAYVDRMAAAAERLHRVSLECGPGIELVEKFGAFDTVCLYVDPPYVGSTRCRNYRTEMVSDGEHLALLDALLAARAAVVLSGYASDLYDDALTGWSRIELPSATGQGGTYADRTEVIWANRPVAAPGLFEVTA
jgi:DNA adenine methylase